jgi:(p)ppGpp synthase/HD superfamily hydrolase
MVKLADRITNLQPPSAHWTKEKVAKFREQAIEIWDALGEASELRSSRLLAKAEAYKAVI